MKALTNECEAVVTETDGTYEQPCGVRLATEEEGNAEVREQASHATRIYEPAEDGMPGFINLYELEELCQQAPPDYLVEGLLPAGDVHVAVGDSGLGKTAWAYQLGLCVASGKPFLGHAVRQSPVVYYDMENGRQQVLDLAHGLCRHLAIKGFPRDFFLFLNEGDRPKTEYALARQKAGLVIIDSLRAFEPDAEMENSNMAALLEILRSNARKHHAAVLLVHHIRKSNDYDRAASLEETPTMEWLQRASGARALANQTNTRIALALPDKADAALVMKSFVKLKGETGSIYLQRVSDEAGEPIGYQRLVGPGLLGNADQEAAFAKLPERFSFKQAKQTYQRSDDPTRKWLQKCIAVGIVEQEGRGMYRKLPAADVYNCKGVE
jgi:hypothetical protein